MGNICDKKIHDDIADIRERLAILETLPAQIEKLQTSTDKLVAHYHRSKTWWAMLGVIGTTLIGFMFKWWK